MAESNADGWVVRDRATMEFCVDLGVFTTRELARQAAVGAEIDARRDEEEVEIARGENDAADRSEGWGGPQ